MKRQILSLSLILISFGLQGQTYRDEIMSNPDKAGGNYHYYEYGQGSQTPAPKGYTPFYISHYGRHGSRWHSNDRHFGRCLPALMQCDSAGILTADGKSLLDSLKIIEEQSRGLYGMLTERGAMEHRGIAARMYDNFPDVFRNRIRTKVNCVSSKVPRCIISMGNFVLSLKDKAPGLDYSIATGDKYHNYIAPHVDMDDVYKDAGKLGGDLKKKGILPDRFISSLFTDIRQALGYIGDPQKFMLEVYTSGATGHNTVNRTSIYSHFTTDELISLWMPFNDEFYYSFGISEEAGTRSAEIAIPILRDILDKADSALTGRSRTAADLRFGHDTDLLPLAGYIGIDGIGGFSAFKAHDYLQNYNMICMGSNLQLIFYRSRKEDDILVKVLYNEQERYINGLTPYSGPYYKWSDLRNRFSTLVETGNHCENSESSFIVLGDMHYCEERFYDLDRMLSEKPSDYRQITGTYAPLSRANWDDQIDILRRRAADPSVKGIVQLGDVSEGLGNKEGSPDSIAVAIVGKLTEAKMSVPWILVKGNHDITGEGGFREDARKAFEKYYTPFISSQINGEVRNGNYCYETGDCLFVALDPYNSGIDQVEFARKALSSSFAAHKFVILHEPVIPVSERCWHFLKRDEAKRNELLKTIAQNKAIILCGHLHRYSVLRRNTEWGPVVQVMVTSVTDLNRREKPTYSLSTEQYGEYLVDWRPDFSPENAQWRRDVLNEESSRVDYYQMSNIAGYGIITIKSNRHIVLRYYPAFSDVPYDEIDLTELYEGRFPGQSLN